MKKLLSLTIILICLSTAFVSAQKRTSRKRVVDAPSAVCVGSPIPKGYVAIAVEKSASCPKGIWTLKKPGEVETVCNDSQVPDGYEMKEITGAEKCGGLNPLNNAMVIVRADVSYTPRSYEQPATRPSVTNRESIVSSIVEARADEVNRKARLQNAVNNHEIAPGMTMEQVVKSWGRPASVDKYDSSSSRNNETWIYRKGGQSAHLDFKDGILQRWAWFH